MRDEEHPTDHGADTGAHHLPEAGGSQYAVVVRLARGCPDGAVDDGLPQEGYDQPAAEGHRWVHEGEQHEHEDQAADAGDEAVERLALVILVADASEVVGFCGGHGAPFTERCRYCCEHSLFRLNNIIPNKIKQVKYIVIFNR